MCLEQIEANRQRKVDQLIVGQKFKTEINELQKNNALKEQMKEDNYKNVIILKKYI